MKYRSTNMFVMSRQNQSFFKNKYIHFIFEQIFNLLIKKYTCFRAVKASPLVKKQTSLKTVSILCCQLVSKMMYL